MFTITSLGSELDAWVRDQVGPGRFDSEAEVFFEAMRLFRETTENPDVGRAVLKAQIEAGMRGPFHLASKAFDDIEAELRAKLVIENAA